MTVTRVMSRESGHRDLYQRVLYSILVSSSTGMERMAAADLGRCE